jgi:hypothetical protein
MADNINTTTSTSMTSNNASCPIMKLAPELRQMIYEYYFEDRKLPRVPKRRDYIDPFDRIEIRSTGLLRPYSGLLQYSSGVRRENVRAIYRARFTGVWLLCDISEQTDELPARKDELKCVKDICSLIRDVDKDIEFGLHFVISDYEFSDFMSFVESFVSLQAVSEDMLSWWPEYVQSARYLGEQMLTSSTSGICYTYWSTATGGHELWLFGTLAKLDWSKFSFEFPTPTLMEVDDTDEEYDAELDSEEEYRALYCDEDDNDDGGDSEVDGERGIFAGEDEASSLDVEDQGFMLDSADDGEERQFDDENEAVLLDDELWSDIE